MPSVGILVDCPDCSEVRVASDEVTLRLCIDNSRWSYWFKCPVCQRRASAPTRPGPALEAIAAGSSFEPWQIPAELHESHDGPAFRFVDMVELQMDLMRPDWIDALKQV